MRILNTPASDPRLLWSYSTQSSGRFLSPLSIWTTRLPPDSLHVLSPRSCLSHNLGQQTHYSTLESTIHRQHTHGTVALVLPDRSDNIGRPPMSTPLSGSLPLPGVALGQKPRSERRLAGEFVGAPCYSQPVTQRMSHPQTEYRPSFSS